MEKLTLDQALLKGIEAHKAGHIQDADRYYTAVLKANPMNADANHNMGVLAAGIGKINEALPFFRNAVEANAKVAQYWLSYLNAYIDLGNFTEAKSIIDEAKARDLDFDVLQKLEQRLKSISQEPTGKTPPSHALQNLINLFDDKKFDQTLLEASALQVKFPKSVNLQNLIAASQHALGRLDEAAASYRLAISLEPKVAELHHNLGNALKESGKIEQARDAYQKALSIDPEYAEAHFNLGSVFKILGKFEQSINAYHKAISHQPEYFEAFLNLGNVYQSLESFDDAVESYEKALSIKPNSEAAYFNLGTALKRQSKLQDAIMAFDKVNSASSKARALECAYILSDTDQFNKRLSNLAKNDPTNIRAAALSAFASHQLKQENFFPFCKNPMEMVHKIDARERISDFDNFIDGLMQEMIDLNAPWEPEGKTTKGGFQTPSTLFSLDLPNLANLKKLILEELDVYHQKFQKIDDLLIQDWPDEVKLNAWFVRLLKGGHQASHIHPTGWVSGVFYLKTVTNPTGSEGAIKFGLHGYDYPIKDKNYPIKTHQPQSGELILFPSCLFHETIPVKQDVERCVIAFDLVV